MWDTPSQYEAAADGGGRRWEPAVDLVFAVVALALLYAMYALDGYETVPYHVLFVTFAAVYGFRGWSLPVTVGVLGAIVFATGAILVEHWRQEAIPSDELTEIVLMPMILGAMVWHARRRVAAQQELQRMAQYEHQRRLREHEFARDTSHAVRTPLTIARGHIELIKESSDDEMLQQDAGVALAELDRIGRMASRLLSIAELERPDVLNPRPVDVAALARDTHDRWSASVPRVWSLECPAMLWARVDEDVLRIVIDALIENAVGVTSTDDELRVVCRRDQDHVLLGVADSGPGIPPSEADRVFDRFWRSSTKREGTGLGLSYVRAAAEAHAGTALVAPSPLGGAFVACRLPLVPTGHAGDTGADELLARHTAKA